MFIIAITNVTEMTYLVKMANAYLIIVDYKVQYGKVSVCIAIYYELGKKL